MYNPLPKCLTIKESEIHGRGLFAVEYICSGTVLGITHIRKNGFENGYIRTPLGGFYNHSEVPNCKTWFVDDLIYLVAIENIEAGEELTSKYKLYKPL